jgi:CBS-domain-containing membrane protein
MTRAVRTVHAQEMLSASVGLMWNHDLGCIPVLDDHQRLVGIVTDRDACMAAHLHGRALDEIPVAQAMSKQPVRVQPDDPVQLAIALMARHQVRRVLVVDVDDHVLGVLGLSDILRHAGTPGLELDDDRMLEALRAIARPHKVIAMTPAMKHDLLVAAQP